MTGCRPFATLPQRLPTYLAVLPSYGDDSVVTVDEDEVANDMSLGQLVSINDEAIMISELHDFCWDPTNTVTSTRTH
jgi:hypothetical protein